MRNQDLGPTAQAKPAATSAHTCRDWLTLAVAPSPLVRPAWLMSGAADESSLLNPAKLQTHEQNK